MNFTVTEAMNGFIIEDNDGTKAVLTFERKPQIQAHEPKEESEHVSVHVGDDGKADGVLVSGLGERFVISLHDLDEGKNDFSYETLMPRLKELGIQTFTKKQAQLVCFYLDEINDKLKEAGGDPIAEDWYLTQDLYIPRGSSADYHASYTWCFSGSYGCLNYYYRYDSYFLCRPSLALPFQN